MLCYPILHLTGFQSNFTDTINTMEVPGPVVNMNLYKIIKCFFPKLSWCEWGNKKSETGEKVRLAWFARESHASTSRLAPCKFIIHILALKGF